MRGTLRTGQGRGRGPLVWRLVRWAMQGGHGAMLGRIGGKWCIACGLGEQAWPRVLQHGCLLRVAAWEGDVQLDLACFGGLPCMGADWREAAAGARVSRLRAWREGGLAQCCSGTFWAEAWSWSCTRKEAAVAARWSRGLGE